MSPSLIPLLIAALLLATTDANAESVEVVLAGQHQIAEQSGALIVGDAEVTIPPGAELPGPIYVIGGELVIAGGVASDVIQLAGTVTVAPGARIGDELRHIGGTESVAAGAQVGRRTDLDLAGGGGGPAGFVSLAVLSLLLALVGAWLEKRRRPLVDNVASTLTGHPVVTTTVGALLAMTGIAVTVFMAFTLVLLPIALIAILIGVLTTCYGLVVLGHLIGSRLPIAHRGLATGAGVVGVVVLLWLVGLVPLVGDVVVFGAVLSSLGAVVISYYGVARFRPAALPSPTEGEG